MTDIVKDRIIMIGLICFGITGFFGSIYLAMYLANAMKSIVGAG